MRVPVIVMGAKGRMGATIARMAQESDKHELVAVVERPEYQGGLEHLGCLVGSTLDDILPQVEKGVVIDFTAPEVSLANAEACIRLGHAIVIGTTGFTDAQRDELAAIAQRAPVFWAPNMSIGINVLCNILPALVKALGEEYDLEMVELHHNKKKDSPSGTALRLAECLAAAREWDLGEVAEYHREGIIGERPKEEIGIQTIRGGDVVGVHTVFCMGPGERIEVTHQAHSRENFAIGSLRAAHWMFEREPGKLYGMQDVL